MRELNADVVVVGAGPAGVAAACEAAERNVGVLLLDENPAPGGQIWRSGTKAPPPAADAWFQRLAATAAVTKPGTGVVDATGPHELFVQDADGVSRVRANTTILATGARELFVPFPGWTLPGVLGAGGIQALAKTGWPVAGERVVVAGSGPLLLAVAGYLTEAGAQVVALVEQAERRTLMAALPTLAMRPAKLRQAIALGLSLRGVPKYYGSWPVRAEGEGNLERLTIRTPRGDRDVDCELVGCGFGLVPETRLARVLGASCENGRVKVDGDQQTSVPRLYAAGELTGVGGVDVALAEGCVAGCAAAGDTVAARQRAELRDKELRFTAALDRAFVLRPEIAALAEPDTIVCRCEDVTFSEVAGFDDARDAKLKTRCGMGPCQGRVCGPALRLIKGWSPDRIRPPLLPIPTVALAEISAASTREVTP